MPKGYLSGNITGTDAEAYAEYVRRDTPILERYGGRLGVRSCQSETLDGASDRRHAMIELPSYAAARAAYNDPPIPDRRRHSQAHGGQHDHPGRRDLTI
jgi:uncharacterized protein (DUF1330 family)